MYVCRTIEWTIANFSCWNNTVHGSKITSPRFNFSASYYGQCELFENSNGKLAVRFGGNNKNSYLGNLSLTSSNGSIISTKDISYTKGSVVQFPEFTIGDLVAKIRSNEAHHQDHLTVRCRFRDALNDPADYVRTTIKVHKISVKVPYEKFEEVIEGNPIQVIRFPLKDDDEIVQIVIHGNDNTYSSVLESVGISERILVSVQISVLYNDFVIHKINDGHRFIQEGEKKTLVSLTKKEVKKEHVSLFIDLKIIPRIDCEYKDHFYVDGGVYVAQTNSLKSGSYSFVSLQKSPNNPKIVTSSNSIDNDPVADLSNSSSNSKIITSSNSIKDDPVAVLTKELMCLFQDHDFSDLQLNCGGVSLPVHKAILSARSPVLKRLLSSDMREAASGSVDIEDLDAPTLARFLAFLYTGSVEDLQGESALKLYYAADKYEVPSLKSECVSVMTASVAVSNVCDILSLADRHQDDHLTTVAHDFILRNYIEVLGSSEWESFIKREPLLAVNTVTVFAREKKVKAGTS